MRDQKRATFFHGRDFVATMASLASAGFGVMAALAWNEAIKAAVVAIFPQGNTGKLISLFIYAALVTAIAVLVVNSLAKLTERLGGDKKL